MALWVKGRPKITQRVVPGLLSDIPKLTPGGSRMYVHFILKGLVRTFVKNEIIYVERWLDFFFNKTIPTSETELFHIKNTFSEPSFSFYIIVFKASAVWADAFYKSKCLYVCLFVHHTFSLRLTVFLSPLPEVQCPNFLDIQNPWGKVMERSGLRFENFCS